MRRCDPSAPLPVRGEYIQKKENVLLIAIHRQNSPDHRPGARRLSPRQTGSLRLHQPGDISPRNGKQQFNGYLKMGSLRKTFVARQMRSGVRRNNENTIQQFDKVLNGPWTVYLKTGGYKISACDPTPRTWSYFWAPVTLGRSGHQIVSLGSPNALLDYPFYLAKDFYK